MLPPWPAVKVKPPCNISNCDLHLEAARASGVSRGQVVYQLWSLVFKQSLHQGVCAALM